MAVMCEVGGVARVPLLGMSSASSGSYKHLSRDRDTQQKLADWHQSLILLLCRWQYLHHCNGVNVLLYYSLVQKK